MAASTNGSSPAAAALKFLIYGRTGWNGGLLGKLCDTQSVPFAYGAERLENRAQLEADLDQAAPTHVFNAVGVTGRPNVDWCDTHRVETVHANVVTPFSYGADDESDDHPLEKCGLVRVFSHPYAASLRYLGLQKLQHRGEEGAGIDVVGGDGKLKSVTGLGLVANVFDDPSRLASLPGPAAIAHMRYSTVGTAVSLRNVQPFLAGYRFGQVAVAHNDGLVKYHALRSKLEARGSIFNTTSDTEVILHLISTSRSRPLLARICDACERLAGAYSLLFMGVLPVVRDVRRGKERRGQSRGVVPAPSPRMLLGFQPLSSSAVGVLCPSSCPVSSLPIRPSSPFFSIAVDPLVLPSACH